jgi:hypothetical protein
MRRKDTQTQGDGNDTINTEPLLEPYRAAAAADLAAARAGSGITNAWRGCGTKHLSRGCVVNVASLGAKEASWRHCSPDQWLLWRIVEPINFVMEQKMLRTIKQRVEVLASV